MTSKMKPLFPDFGKTFGKNLPTPVFDTIELSTVDMDADSEAGDLEITSYISISMTKPDHKYMDVNQLIEHYFDDLYLYVYFSPFESLNTELEEKRLNLRDLFDAYKEEGLTPANFVGPGYIGLDHYGRGYDVPTALYNYVIEYQKKIFFEKIHTTYFEPMTKTGDAEDTILGYTIAQAKNLLENPTEDAISDIGVNAIYRLFWGTKGPAGRWDYDDDIGSGLVGWLNDMTRGRPADDNSFMRFTLASTLLFLTSGGYTSNYTWARKISLKEFLGPDNHWGAVISEDQEYDKNGNSIFKISDITIRTLFNFSSLAARSRLNTLDKVFSIAFVGLDISSDGVSAATGDSDARSTSYGWGVPYRVDDGMEFGGDDGVYDLRPRRSLFNTYFGNIVYEHVMERGAVVDNPTEAFYRVSDETQYDDIPIQALNSRYYVNEPVSRVTIEKEMKKLIGSFEVWRPTNESLDSNIKNLEYILETNKDSPNTFMKFRDYMRTYSDKSPINQAGKFYNEFRSLATQLVKGVMTQERVTKKVFRSTVVHDARGAEGGSISSTVYVAPYVYSGTGNFKAGDTDEPSAHLGGPYGSYIPEKWSRYISNVVFQTFDTGDEADKQRSEWWTRYELYLSIFRGEIDGEAYGITDGGWADAYEAGMDGVDADIMAMACELTDRHFASHSEYEVLGMHDYVDEFHSSGTGARGVSTGGYSGSPDHRGNRVVINDGWFFFDWEKAMHTYSALSHFASPSAIHRFLGYRVPYEDFPVISAALARVGISGGGDIDSAHFIECRMQTQYNGYSPSDGVQTYPKSSYSLSSAYPAGKAFRWKTLKYHKAGGVDGGGGAGPGSVDDEVIETSSYLKFVNFDVMNGDIYSGTKTLRNFVPWTAAFPYTPVELGSRVANDYRLMAYRFRDLMDDDIAHKNAIAGNIAEDELTDSQIAENNKLEVLNTRGEPFGQYRFYACVEDNSLEVLKSLYSSLVSPALERFNEYKERAEEMCSYNNIEDRFNTFFANGMESLYNIGTPPPMTTFAGPPDPQPPWFETPYLIAAFQMVLQRQYMSSDITNAELDVGVLDHAIVMAKQCNPRTGSLLGVEIIRDALAHIGDMLTLQDEDTLAKVREIIGDDTITHIDEVFDMNYAVTPITDAADLEYFPSSGGSLPPKCAFFLGAMQQDQPIFGDVMLDTSIELSVDGIDEAPEVPEEPEPDASSSGPGTDTGWLTRIDDAMGATYAEFVADSQLQALVEGLLADGAAIMNGLAQIEADIQSSTVGDPFSPFSVPSDWILDGTILWAHLSAYAAGVGTGFTLSDTSIYSNMISHSARASSILNNYFVEPFRDAMSSAHSAGVTPSLLAHNGILANINSMASTGALESMGVSHSYYFPRAAATYSSEFLTSGLAAAGSGGHFADMDTLKGAFISMDFISSIWA